MTDDFRDELPEDLNAVDHIGVYDFPDNSRRRIPGIIYAVMSVCCIVVWGVNRSGDSSLVNGGLVFAAVVLGFMSVVSLTSGWKMTVNESDALVVATRKVGFAVGHASAQQVWRGLRSRPTWRIFCYSAEEPPLQRGLVLVDAVNGDVVECLIEDNPESEVPSASASGE